MQRTYDMSVRILKRPVILNPAIGTVKLTAVRMLVTELMITAIFFINGERL